MECQEIMNPVKTHLYADDAASTAIDFMIQNHMGLVPVVDRQDAFIGLLSGDRLMHFMLPKSVSMMRGKKYASFLKETHDDLKERLDDLRQLPISELVDREVKVAYPDTGLTDALISLSENQNVVPIVERETNKLIGAISFFTVLNALEKTNNGHSTSE